VAGELERIEARQGELERRITELSERRDAYGARLVEEFRELQSEVDRINERGALGTQWALKGITEKQDRLEAAFTRYVAEQEAERIAQRRILRTALIGAASALGVALLTLLFQLAARALSGGGAGP
jgi:phage shock protein A